MFENRNLKHDLMAIGLLGCVIFLCIAVATYDAADPIGTLVTPLHHLYQPDTLVYPQNNQVSNACGSLGALASGFLLTNLGVGAYYLVATLALLDYLLLRRQVIDDLRLRAVGWIASMVGLTTLSTMLFPAFSPGPVIGCGGYLGALISGILQWHFATAGSLILAVSITVVGLLLCTDYALISMARTVVVYSIAAGMILHSRLLPRRSRHASGDAELDEEEEDEPVELSVRIRGKRQEEIDSPEAETAEYEDDEEDYEEEEEEDEYEEEYETEAEEEAVIVKAPVKPVKLSEPPEEAVEAKPQPPSPHFNIKKKKGTERDEVMSQLDEADRAEHVEDYQLPSIDLLLEGDEVSYDEQEKEVRRKAKILEKTFAEFGFHVRVVEIETGPVIAQYEVQLEAGLRLSKITGLADDLAIALRVPSVRIVAPIPGKNTVGIEVPNETRQVVRLREVMEEGDAKTRKMKIPLFLGKDVSGNPLTVDLATLPHLLIAGRTGTGKSVCLNAIISSILMTRRPDEVRMLMIDPKMVELSGYGRLPHLMHPVVTDMKKAEAILAWAVDKMEERYALLARAGVRHITSYNQLGEEELMDRLQPESDEERSGIPVNLPFIVIVADEMADLMMTAGKEVEQHIIRLAQKSRAVGIHLILATQKPTVDVITGLIKSNLPARIAFQVASRTDSRVVLDEMGSEKLLGNGDMLFLWPGTSSLLRGQGTYLSDDEIESVTDSVSTGEQNFVNELVNMKVADEEESPQQGLKKRDELYESAVDVVVREGRGSVSLLQRALGIGYGRAARLIDFMAEDGIVGPYAGSQAREVMITPDRWEQMQGLQSSDSDSPAPSAPASRKVSLVTDTDEEWASAEQEDEAEYEYEYEEQPEADDTVAEAEASEEELDEYEEEYEEYEDADEEDEEYEYEDEEEEYEYDEQGYESESA